MRRGKQGEEGSALRGEKRAERWRKRGEEGRAARREDPGEDERALRGETSM